MRKWCSATHHPELRKGSWGSDLHRYRANSPARDVPSTGSLWRGAEIRVLRDKGMQSGEGRSGLRGFRVHSEAQINRVSWWRECGAWDEKSRMTVRFRCEQLEG